MKRSDVSWSVLILFLVFTMYILQGCSEMDDPSQDATGRDMATFTGRVVDINGEPVAQLSLFMQYIRSDNEGLQPEFDLFLKTETDENGRFAIIGINPGQLQLVLVPYYELHRYDSAKYKLLSIRIGEVVYYPDESSPYSPDYRASFSIVPGAQIENVEVTVESRMRIQGKIVFKDGTPLVNWPIYLRTQYEGFEGGRAGYSRPTHTDADGFFTRYVSEPGLYTVTVKFQELTATSEQFRLNEGKHRENLVLMFDSEPIPWSAKWW